MTRHHFVTRLALVAAVLGLMAVTVPSASLVADSLPGTLALPAATDPQMDHLLFLDVTPHGERPPRQVRREAMDAFDRLFPLLAQLQEQGQIVDFWPLPEAGAVMVQGPETDALVQIRTWAGVADVVPATAEAMRGVQNSVGALQHAQVPADRLDLQPEPSAERPMALTGVGDLYGFTIYLNENRVTGTVYTGTTSIDLTLRTSSGVVKSQTTTAPTSSGYFYGYFDELVLGGDQVVVELPGQAPVTIQAAPLAVASNKATDNVWGSGVPSSELYACAYGYGRYNLCEWVLTDAGGSFSVDFGLLSIDLFMGDETYLWYYDADGFATTLQDQYVQGVYVSPASHYVSGYASPGASVSVTLKDSAGGVKATNSATASGYGSFYTYFSSTPGMAIGDRVEVQYGSEPIVSVDVVLATLAGVDPGTDTVHGTAPPNGKVEVWVYDDYLSEEAELTVTSDGAGQYVANYAGVLDFTPGSYTSAVYHDSLDNEVYAGALYAGPWAKVLLNDSSDMEGAAGPGERVEAMLRNAVGAIKSTAAAVAGSTGYFYLYFYDSAGNSIVVVPGDVVNVSFESGTNYTINTVGIDYLIDRNARTVTGVGPANSTVRLIYDYDTAVNVTTDANGAFSHTFSYMAGGQYFQAILRDVHQNDVERWGYTPQFTVYPDDDYLYGYGVFNQPVVVEVLSSGGTSKGTAYTTAGPYGYYWLSLHDIDPVVGDTVVVDTWPFHYTQVIVPLSIAADPENDLVYGTVPPGAWLNVYASSSFGPYSHSLYKYFYADGLGNFVTDFSGSSGNGPGDIRYGDSISVLYWEGSWDRVRIGRYVIPVLYVDATTDRIWGYTTPGTAGTVTVLNSAGVVKSSGSVTASEPSGYFSFTSDVDVVAGDQVSAQIGALNRMAPVIVLDGALDLAGDAIYGTSLPNTQIGYRVYTRSGSYYYTYSGFVTTDAGGAFNLNIHNQADLAAGDYLYLYYIDAQDTHYQAVFYTTQPQVTVTNYPTAVPPAGLVEVQYDISDGVHPGSTAVRWDVESHASDNAYGNATPWRSGILGSVTATFGAPMGGTIYFKAYASVDGQGVWSEEYTIDVVGEVRTMLVEPRSGTTNDSTPHLAGVADPGWVITVYDGATEIASAPVDEAGWFNLDVPTPLSAVRGSEASVHELRVLARQGDEERPWSNLVRLTVDPSLIVNPAGVQVVTRGSTQFLRDENGEANLGGRAWNRPGDIVEVSIPISATSVYSASLVIEGAGTALLLDSGDHVFVGTYTAPASGTYRLLLMVRQDGPAGPVSEIVLLNVVIATDGYVYNAQLGPDYRLANAEITVFELVDEATDDWQVWPGSIWYQLNPVRTEADGYYGFFPLPGKYSLEVTIPGFRRMTSPLLTVADGPLYYNFAMMPLPRVYVPVVFRGY